MGKSENPWENLWGKFEIYVMLKGKYRKPIFISSAQIDGGFLMFVFSFSKPVTDGNAGLNGFVMEI